MSLNITKDDLICSDRFLEAFPDNYFKADIFYLNYPFVWRGRTVSCPDSMIDLIIVGHSDYPVTNEIASRYPGAAWFSSNSLSSQVIGLPLGISNDTDESPLHRIYGNASMMIDVMQQPRVIKNLVYMNFTCATYPPERVPLKNMLESQSWVTVRESVNTFEGRRTFLEDVRNHSFVVCPRGNGIDTHRLWETLYMGSIPIVKWDVAHAGWTDLPILFIDDWNEITEERLNAEKVRIESSTWNLDKLRVGYWVDRIKQSK
jgi:hypothetical protein